ncbi:hypothetical protein [Xenorhabdus griffiniae]|uniref:DUF1640 domain-containing protein n=1 Tax=Xenorhabdus griffiniae TaxID=351672 RepID=A0ABY9XCJ6_9GAMM|nr:hypothetical protein [Xenorhabdus griffiniae]MBD1226412.1 hypothetical protein [Xenorhabdus griffiniae]MBE8588731.1 hypothetical protein [Xenorhabdus griffiniae]WMV70638.1 hypothetical protein QL128_10345 [Xenorhabdus griffiniae]WNH00315.1 hypothetical protein QL112_010350 [Xenorhabdus griffiniae]
MSTNQLKLRNAVKLLKDSGINDEQAEKIVEVITELCDINTKTSVESEKLKSRTNLKWNTSLLLIWGTIVLIAVIKYIIFG